MKTLLTSRASALRPLVVQGQRVLDLQQSLSRLLAARSGDPKMALLLASPRLLARRDEIVWDTQGEGEVIRLVDADGPVRADGERRFAASLATAQTVIEALRHGDDSRKRDAAALEAALTHPGESDWFLVGEVPVLVNWGCAAVTAPETAKAAVRTSRRVAEAPRVGAAETIAQQTKRVPPKLEPKPRRPIDPWQLAWGVVLLLAIAAPFGVRSAMSLPTERLQAEKDGLQTSIARLQSLATDVTAAREACSTAASPDATRAGRIAAAKVPSDAVATLTWDGADHVDLLVGGPSAVVDSLTGGGDEPRHVGWFTMKAPLPKNHLTFFIRLPSTSPLPVAPARWDFEIRLPGQASRQLGGYLRAADGNADHKILEVDLP